MTPSKQIDKQISELKDWRGELYSKLRKLILSVDKDLSEDFKWDTCIMTLNGNIIGICTFKDHVKLNFFKGAKLKDKFKLFNAGLEAKNSRGIDFFEKDKINEIKLSALIKEAVELNK